jgi:signal transduction histidine kinase
LGEENRKTFASPRGSVYNCAMPTDPPSGSVKEEARIRALQRTGLLDSPPEEIFDCLTRLAAKTLGVPVALLSLVDSDRQFFKSQTGLPPEWAGKRETPLSYSFCQYVVASDQPLVVSNAHELPLVCDNLAVRDLNVTAYAGVPLMTADGRTLGSFCAIDVKPRNWTARDLEILHTLADQAMIEINLRLRLGELQDDLKTSRHSIEKQTLVARQNVHDLRTPATAIMLGLEAVEAAGPLNKEQRQFLELAKANTHSLRILVNELLEADSSLTLETCSAMELVERALDQITPLADRARITITLNRVISPAVTLQADKDALVRVLVNLLANAIKFTPSGRGVTVEVEEITKDQTIRFSVNDEGIGIAPQDLPQLFQDGGRLDHHASPEFSSGIGLAYCKRVVEAHGGRIDVRSRLGFGSSFSFVIPLAIKTGTES